MFSGKKISKARLAWFLFFYLFCLSAYGRERPAWVNMRPKVENGFKYYVGRASGAENEAAGFSEATRDAYDQALRENFGVRTKIDSQVYETSSQVSSSKRVLEVSRNVEFHEFEQVESYSEPAGDERLHVWLLYRYPLKAILTETSRLSRQSEEDETSHFSEVGRVSNAQNGIIEITTKPSGARVFIDGEASGFVKTPMRVSGSELSVGAHTLRIDHPNYEPIEENVVLLPGTVVKISKVLIPAMGKIRVVTNPSNANVVIQGRPVGTSPTEVIPVPAGVPLSLEITHAETEKTLQEVRIERNEEREISVPLILKPSTVSIFCEPNGAKVSVAGESHTCPTGPIKLSAGTRQITVFKSGYTEETLSVSLRGGESRVLPTIHLRKLSDAALRLQDPPLILSAHIWGRGESNIKGLDTKLAAQGIGVQFKPLSYLGIEVNVLYRHATISYNDGDLKLRGWEAVVGLPIYLPYLNFLFIAPEWKYSATTLHVHYKTGQEVTSGGKDQKAVGGSLGGIVWFKAPIDSSVRWGFTFRGGLHKYYGGADGIENATKASMSLGITLGI